MSEISDLLELADAASDTVISSSAVHSLRSELVALGCPPISVDWSPVAAAQRNVEIKYLEIYDFIRLQASEAIK
jgi:hypothetical protein